MPEPIVDASLANAATEIGAKLSAMFPTGAIPHEDAAGGQVIEPVPVPAGATGAAATPGVTGPVGGETGGPTPTADTGTTGTTGAAPSADTGTTGATGAAPSADTGATGAASTGDHFSDEQLDAAQNAMTPRAGTAFKALRMENAKDKARIAELEAKQTTGSELPSDPKELAELKQKVAGYETELAASRIEVTEDFKKNISGPLANVEKDLINVAGKYEVAQNILTEALNEPDENLRSDRLSEISKDFNRIDQNKFDRMVGDFDKLSASKKLALAEAAQKWTEIQANQAKQAQEAKEKFDADWKRAQAVVLEKLEKDLPIFKATGDAEVDAEIEAAKEKVRSLDLSRLTNDELITAFYKEAAYPIFVSQIASLYENQVNLEARVSKLQGTEPGPGSGDPGAPNTGDPKKYDSAISSLKDKMSGILPA